MNMKINIEYVPSAKHDEKLEDAVRSKMKKMRDAVGNAEKSAGCEKAKRTAPKLTVIAENGRKSASSAAKRIKSVTDDIKYDIDAIMERDPAARSRTEAALLYSGFHALMLHRLAHAANEKGAHFTARLISQAARSLTGIEIHPGATIGRGLFIDHGSGVVIGETAIIGDNCTIYQGVTLGGTGKETGKRHPTLGNNVMVGAGAKLLGNFTVGDNSKIAAGAVVLGDVPANSTAVGIPARVVRRHGERITEADLDQTHIPDPVSQDLCKLHAELDEIRASLEKLRSGIEKEDKEKCSVCGEGAQSSEAPGSAE